MPETKCVEVELPPASGQGFIKSPDAEDINDCIELHEKEGWKYDSVFTTNETRPTVGGQMLVSRVFVIFKREN